MFCSNCRTMHGHASNVCHNCGNTALSKTMMLQSPHEEARQMIQINAILCYVIAALHLYELDVATDAAIRFGSALAAAACTVVAWKLWTGNSFVAGIVACTVLCLESSGLLAVKALKFAQAFPNQSGSTISGYIVMLAMGMFAAGCSTLRATMRMKKIAAQSAFP